MPPFSHIRAVLDTLAGVAPLPAELRQAYASPQKLRALASWLSHVWLGSLAAERLPASWPALAEALQGELFATAAEGSLHLDHLQRIQTAAETANLPFALLKGGALAESVYHSWQVRVMRDLDLLVAQTDIPRMRSLLLDLGYKQVEKEDRPLPLQALAMGEMQFVTPDWVRGLIELHYSPFSGWWLQRTARIDHAAVWQRRQPLPTLGPNVYQLSPEDAVLQQIIHFAIGSQFTHFPLRTLLEIALLSRERNVNWALVAERATAWGVKTAVYHTLWLTTELISLPEVSAILPRLAPAPLQQRRLARSVNPDTILAERDLTASPRRFWLLLSLVDTPRQTAVLIFRTLWPESQWRTFRYGRPVSIWHHWRQLIQKRTV